MQKTETPPPAYSGCLARVVIVVIVAFFMWCNHAFGQNKPTREDSLLQIEWNKYIDSVVKKTSMVDFKVFVEQNATAKKEQFNMLDAFFQFFIDKNYELWISKRKPQIKSTSGKNN